MSSLRVTVVPVALKADDDPTQPSLAVSYFGEGSDWLAEDVPDSSTVADAGRSLLARAIPDELRTDEFDAVTTIPLENAGVDYSSGCPNLLLTAVLPIAVTEFRGEAWTKLIPSPGSVQGGGRQTRLDPVRAAIASYWREQLTKTTAALDFLPKYFPASQVRAVYESLWGGSQPESNFQRWLTTARDADGTVICEEVVDSSVRAEAQAAFAKNLTAAASTTAGMTTATAVARAWDPRFIGTSGKVSAMAGLAVIPAAVVAGALVGSLVSWQRSRVTGRPPAWYHRTVATRADLKALYVVRPVVSLPSATFLS